MSRGSKTAVLCRQSIFVRILLFQSFVVFLWAGSAAGWDGGNYLVADGSNDYAELSREGTVDVAVTGEKSFTAEAWIYPTGYGCFLADDAYDVGYITQDGASCIQFQIWFGDRSVKLYQYKPLANGWHHVVVMFDNVNDWAAIGIDGDLSWWKDGLQDDDGLHNSDWPMTIGTFS